MFEQIYDAGGPSALAVALIAIAAVDGWLFSWAIRPRPEQFPSQSSLRRRVALGYFWGANALALPVAIISSIGLLQNEGAVYQLPVILLVPLIIAGQAALLGLLVAFGEFVQSLFRSPTSNHPGN